MKLALTMMFAAAALAAASPLETARDQQDRAALQKLIADFRKAIELDAKNAEAWLWLGVALRKENKDAEARQALEKSLALNPNRVWVKQQLDKTPSK